MMSGFSLDPSTFGFFLRAAAVRACAVDEVRGRHCAAYNRRRLARGTSKARLGIACSCRTRPSCKSHQQLAPLFQNLTTQLTNNPTILPQLPLHRLIDRCSMYARALAHTLSRRGPLAPGGLSAPGGGGGAAQQRPARRRALRVHVYYTAMGKMRATPLGELEALGKQGERAREWSQRSHNGRRMAGGPPGPVANPLRRGLPRGPS